MLNLSKMLSCVNFNSMLDKANDSLQKQWEKNPTAVAVGGVALGVFSVIMVARQINCPKLIPEDIANKFNLPQGVRGEYNQGTDNLSTVTPWIFDCFTLRWIPQSPTYLV